MSDLPAGTPAPSSTGLAPNLAGALSYLLMPLTGIVFFVVEKESRFVRFHAAQSIVVGLGLIAVNIMLAILGAVLSAVPFLGWLIASLLTLAFMFASFVLWVVLLFRAFQGHEWEVPVAADYARKLLASPAPHA
jgi:uncharacterized membrane protein